MGATKHEKKKPAFMEYTDGDDGSVVITQLSSKSLSLSLICEPWCMILFIIPAFKATAAAAVV